MRGKLFTGVAARGSASGWASRLREPLRIEIVERGNASRWAFEHPGPLFPSSRITPELVEIFVRQEYAACHPTAYEDGWEAGDPLPVVGRVDARATRAAPAADVAVEIDDVVVGEDLR